VNVVRGLPLVMSAVGGEITVAFKILRSWVLSYNKQVHRLKVTQRKFTNNMPDFHLRCKHCGKTKGMHQNKTHSCPVGLKTRIGYITYSKDTVFEEKKSKKYNPNA